MQLSLNWLKDFVEIPESLTPEQLGLKLTMHTVEIDGIKKQAENLNNIVIGKILKIEKHPNADKLKVCTVNIGDENLQIVCGGLNLKEEMLVVLAKIGAKVRWHGEGELIELTSATIRGKKSQGMICASTEIGLSEIFSLKNEKEILDLTENNFKPGIALATALKLNDVIFEVDNKSITNRPDLWGHFGIAREISAFLGTQMIINTKQIIANKFSIDSTNSSQVFNSQFSNKFKINIKVENHELCPRYMAIAINGIKIEESPEWMQKRLISVGMRPINNVVDITNYVMLELGQPTHIFDLKKIKNMQIPNFKSQTNIIIRNAKNKEVIKTLDGQDRRLDENVLVIANLENPIAIAGVMGGANTEVDNKTTSILIESANFNPVSIRKTAQKLDLRSEASMRFEKSLDPNLCEIALNRIVELIKEFCPKAEIISKAQDEKKFKLNQGPIKLDLDWLNKRIGQEISKKRVQEILENLGFEIKKNNKILIITIPTWRATKDISIPEDLVEEIIRIYGYNNLKSEMPKVVMQAPEINNERLLERKVKNILSIGAKLTETHNYSFVNEEQLEKLKIKSSSTIKLVNSLSEDLTILKPSLIFDFLKNIKINQAKYENINLFEIDNIFLNSLGNINKNNIDQEKLPRQEKYIGILIANNDEVFSKIKGIVEYLLKQFDLQVNFKPVKNSLEWANKNIIAQISVLNKDIGIVAQLDNQIAENLGIKKQVAVAEINFQKFYDLIVSTPEKKYKELEKYPVVVRDLAFVVNEEILYSDIKNEIENFNKLISCVELFDVYQGGKIGQDKKNLAFRITYQANKTLTTEEINEMQNKIIKHLEKKFQAQIRNF
jgi:phenylalanyl-tRNA synthetase beta chain